MQLPFLRSTTAVVLPVLSLFAAGSAIAQPASPDSTDVERLYHEAAAALDEHKYEKACPMLEKVVQSKPDAFGARLDLAECYEGQTRFASAWEVYKKLEREGSDAAVDAAARGNEKKKLLALGRAAEARKRREKVDPRLSRLQIDVGEKVRATPGLRVMRDGTPVSEDQWGKAWPVDAGSHTVEAVAPGKQPFRKTVEVTGEGNTVPLVIDALSDEATPKPAEVEREPPQKPPPAPVTQAPPIPAKSAGRASGENSQSFGGLRIGGLIVGAIGLGTLAVGTYFGVRAIDKKNASNADNHCHDGNLCDDVGFALREDGYRSGTISTWLFVAGGVATAGGLVLYFTAPKQRSNSTAVLVIAPTSAILTGRF